MRFKIRSVDIIFLVYFILLQFFPANSFAQNIKGSDDMPGSYFVLKNDMKSFQIISGEHGRGYEDYYKVVREKIVHKIEYNYKDYYRDGDVNLCFILNFDGSLDRIDVKLDKSTSDKRLIDIAILSLQQAAPFPPFPKELDAPQLPFSVVVSFKRQ